MRGFTVHNTVLYRSNLTITVNLRRLYVQRFSHRRATEKLAIACGAMHQRWCSMGHGETRLCQDMIAYCHNATKMDKKIRGKTIGPGILQSENTYRSATIGWELWCRCDAEDNM